MSSSSESMSMRWKKVAAANGCGPGKRWGQTCNAIKEGRFVYVFGGYVERQIGRTNKVHVFDTVNMIWSELVVKGTPPTPRDSHSCTTVDDNLYVFGGTDGSNSLNDLHILNTSSNTWVSPNLRGNGPEAREGHSAALIGKKLFIFGGCGKYEITDIYYDDLYILNIDTFAWKRVVPSGTPPSMRDSHTCSSWKEKIIIIGGEDSTSSYLSDVHILDTDSLAWCKLDTTGQLPPRGGHTTVSFGKNLIVFGGFSDEQNLYDDVHVLDLEKNAWTKVAVGEGPSGRFAMAGECLDPQMAGVLVFVGGCNKNLEALNDMYFLHTGLSREVDRDERRYGKLSLRKLLKLKCQEHVVSPPSRFEHGTAIYQAPPVSGYNPPAGIQNSYLRKYNHPPVKRTFKATLTKSTQDAYMYNVEAIIDDKLLRGVVFANRPSSPSTVTDNSDRTTSAGVNVDGNPNSAADSGIYVERCDFNLVDVPVREEGAGEAQRKVGALEIKTQEADLKEEESAPVNKNPEAFLDVEVAPCRITILASPESLVDVEILESLLAEPVMESQNDAGGNVLSPSFFDDEILQDADAMENQNAP